MVKDNLSIIVRVAAVMIAMVVGALMVDRRRVKGKNNRNAVAAPGMRLRSRSIRCFSRSGDQTPRNEICSESV
jgi:hypothetical protein